MHIRPYSVHVGQLPSATYGHALATAGFAALGGYAGYRWGENRMISIPVGVVASVLVGAATGIINAIGNRWAYPFGLGKP